MKNRNDHLIDEIVRSGHFRVTVEGRIETNRKWNGHRDVEVPWYICDRADGRGYRYVSYHMVRLKAHRVAYLLYHPGETLTGFEINHLNADRLDNTKENLERCDAVRQSKHAHDARLNPSRGETHHRAKLTDAAVRAMRRLRKLGVPYTVLARQYGVTPAGARFACTRHTWKHIN